MSPSHTTTISEPVRGGAPGSEILRVESLSKTFPGTKALSAVDLEIRAGEVHALVGHNGSGKSTLIKVLSGFHQADEGARVFLDGAPIGFGELSGSHGARISFVHQDLGLILELNAVDNLAMHGGFRRTRLGNVDWRDQRELARRLMAPFDHQFDVDVPLSKVTPVERTILAIAASLQGWDSEGGVLVLDEPTAVLPPREVGRLFEIVERIRAAGAGVLYVSHRIEEIFALADRVTVLRGGRRVATCDVASVDKHELVRLMLGDEVEADYRPAGPPPAEADIVLEVRHLGGFYVRDVSFDLRRGEVLGVAGLPADGRDELPRLLTDQTRRARGEARLGGASDAPFAALRRLPRDRVVLLPADRARDGLLAPMSVSENMSISVLERFRERGRFSRPAERRFVRRWMEALSVRAPSAESPISTLSGGNQQKVLFGRVLGRDPDVLVMSEPTAGVDIGARHAIYDLVTEQARGGLSVIVTSSDIADLVAICDRVLVLRHGRVVEELSGDSLGEFQLVRAMEGAEEGSAGDA